MKNLETIRENKDAELRELYEKWPDVKKYLRSKGCNTAEAEDIFQEALLIFSRKIDDPSFELTVDSFHYVKSTCKFIWYNSSRKNSKQRTGELHDNISEEESDWLIKELRLRQLENAILKIGKQCQQILKLFCAYK